MSDLTDRVHKRLDEFASLNAPGWNDPRDKPITPEIIAAAKAFWTTALEHLGPEMQKPAIFPSGAGIIQFEWDRGPVVTLEIELFPDGHIEFLYLAYEAENDKEGEITEAQAIDLMRRFFAGEVLSGSA